MSTPAPGTSVTGEPHAGPDDVLGRTLVTAAAQVFAERGYEGAAVADIAARAGVTTGAIYSRFDGKAALLAAAVDANLSRELANLVHLDVAPTEIMTRLGSGLLDGDPAANSLLLEAFTLARREPAFASVLCARIAEVAGRLTDVVDRARAAGAVDDDADTAAVVALSLSLAFGTALMRSVGVPSPGHSAWDRLIGRLVSAVAPAAPATATNRVKAAP